METRVSHPAKSEDQDDELAALRDVGVINDDALTFGLPSVWFWGGVVMTLAWAFIFRATWWLVSPLFALVYFSAAYAVHKDDPRGAQGWMRALTRPSTWSGGRHANRRVCFLDEQE